MAPSDSDDALSTVDPPAETAPAARVSLRQRNRSDKLLRIRTSARDLFLERGFEETTLRDIAARARVGFGTIFSYVADKIDLLNLVVYSEYGGLIAQTCVDARTKTTLIEQLMFICDGVLSVSLRWPALIKVLLSQVGAESTGEYARRFIAVRDSALAEMTSMIASARAAGQIGTSEDPRLIAETVNSVLSWQIRTWVSLPEVDLAMAKSQLRRMLTVVLVGVVIR